MKNGYLVALLVTLMVASATYAFFSYDETVKGGVLSQLAHYARYIFSAFSQR